MSNGIRIILATLALTIFAAARAHLSGHVLQVDPANIYIRTRFRPRVPFTITADTLFYCGRERVRLRLINIGDVVVVTFKAKEHEWIADEVKIQAGKKVCSARIASDTVKP